MKTTFLILEDGTTFSGKAFGKSAPLYTQLDTKSLFGEVVFNTSMCGYQQILTDPSYHGQMVVMTSPHIGNYGCEPLFSESTLCPIAVPASALVIRSLYEGPLPPKRVSLDAFMKEKGVCGIQGIDTRALTLHLRLRGSCNALLLRGEHTSLTVGEKAKALETLRSLPTITERNLIEGVSVRETLVDPPSSIPTPASPILRFALVDFGIKASIIAELYKRNVAVTLLPSTATANDVLSQGCDALFLSNGPGDPMLLSEAVAMTKAVMEILPTVGICLGHQILTLALGGKTTKMKFGHHGANHPVRDMFTGRTFVTSQNHGFMSEATSLPSCVLPWFINANDQSIEGLWHTEKPIASVQFHPEASPGPRDGSWIFDRFITVAQGERT
ncbi:MAG TPA: glutamine-hydrolyzing carbamoyl-phosphate synthase small subunit [Sphaerochaeta sp.]|nr:glutamine-hydrolyzing carbamoyl-phosphate synthase small subunit [Sphaerochaeta sp.]